MSSTVYKLVTNDDIVPDEVVEIHEFYTSVIDGKQIADVTIRMGDDAELRLGLPVDRFNIEAVAA